MNSKTALFTAIILVGATFYGAYGQDKDPLKLYPENYKLLFENDRVRVLDFKLTKGMRQ